ncbi:putative acyl-[acyl-carrier protein] desaturase [Streptomyces longispororuber]|uniref:Acyl-[acyl-carrier protein] desaturase n=1 Tax=Streptomyces longispororuber TaxID=68230 RepID=A0A919DGQ6_9ACTN|nr:acyl-ACP desaturase [Streptomyces longispororuber]GHE43677.1 putative acyl-[acyl-carrier protein] desaturase [Streptomyces longispororuber]
MARLDDVTVLRELAPHAAREYERHLRDAIPWYPHQYIPWDQGRNFEGPLHGRPWRPEDSHLPQAVTTSLVCNLLTEDNLPSYHRVLAVRLGRDDVWEQWVHQWTTEEARHSTALRDYLHATRAVDPVALEDARRHLMSTGYILGYGSSPLTALAYTTIQELATRISHRNTGRLSGDPICEQLMRRIAHDENMHMLFYRNMLSAAFDLAPDQAMCALTTVVTSFRMPGHAMHGFARQAEEVAEAGIYDLRIHHDDILQPLLRTLRVRQRTDLRCEGQKARDMLLRHIDRIQLRARRQTAQHAESGRAAARHHADVPLSRGRHST